MTVLSDIPPPDPALERIGKYQWRNGRSWHAAEWNGLKARGTPPPVECFELEWDAEGQPSVTGRRCIAQVSAAQATHMNLPITP